MSNEPELNVSLEEHLEEALIPLINILPGELSSQLAAKTRSPDSTQAAQTRIIPYPLLQSISKWSRTPEGLATLKRHKMSPSDYSMIALLAGTTTSPERRFPVYVPADPLEDQKRNTKDRKAITALVNAVLSVLGSAGATWWASAQTDWQQETRLLVAFLVAAVVGVSETILYIIWESRKAGKSPRKTRRLQARHKKVDEEPVGEEETKSETPENLRQRLTAGTADDTTN
ncbi:hypothetical protein HWV62_13924 [Athelia sp. TMB]|nr:hypothetical protein HWV62_13924 [Athelia sp. TMB]